MGVFNASNGLMETTYYNLVGDLPVVYINFTVKNTTCFTIFRYVINLINNIYVSSNPGETRWVEALGVGDYTYTARLRVGDELVLGRYDPEDGPSMLAVKTPEGEVLYVFKNTTCRIRCVRYELDYSKNDCCSSRHVVLRVARSGLAVELLKDKFPVYTNAGNLYREGDAVEVPLGKELTVEISGVYLERATQAGRAQIKILLAAG